MNNYLEPKEYCEDVSTIQVRQDGSIKLMIEAELSSIEALSKIFNLTDVQTNDLKNNIIPTGKMINGLLSKIRNR
jgi:hypothetical protein